MAREWQKVAAIRRKRISLPRTSQYLGAGHCSTSSVADKGHFVVYTADQRRFMIPLVYLNSEIFRELFEMSEEEFGLPSDGPITLPCDSFFMEYILFLVQRGVAKNLEKALLTSVAHTQSSSAIFSQQEQMNSRLLVCSY
ncbi:auxin-responsive protein SAUR68 [Vitis vinifera]|nr:auxin-responsive protein SAUR68 [Vitis vinifera]